jgi:hypothetical protein
VGEFLDGFESQITGSPFEGVEGAKNTVERVLVFGVFLQNKNALFDVLQKVLSFVAEFVEQIAVFSDFQNHRGFNDFFRTCGRRSIGSGGCGSLGGGLLGGRGVFNPLVVGSLQPAVPFAQRLNIIFGERRALGREIAKKGDCPVELLREGRMLGLTARLNDRLDVGNEVRQAG